MKLVVATGIPGVGKTTVLEGVLEKLDEGFKVINYGDKMLSLAEEKKYVSGRDEIRRLDSETQREIQREAAKAIAGEAEEENIIVDTHCTIKTPKGYLPGLPIWVLEELKPSQFIIVEAETEEIAGRRSTDETRVRDVDSLAEIEEHRQLNRSTAMAYSVLTGATVSIVHNHDDRLEEAVESFRRVI